MTYIGHDYARLSLERHLAPVTMLIGPPSIGKWTLAEYAARWHKVHPSDTAMVKKLTVARARKLRELAGVAPFGAIKLIIIRLDGASEESLNALLKILEEPPSTVRFILVSTDSSLPTIRSRSVRTFMLSRLGDPEVAKILTQTYDMSPASALAAARTTWGSVADALSRDSLEGARATCLSILKSISEHDAELFTQAVKGLDQTTAAQVLQLLVFWIREVLTGDWRMFTEAESFGLAKDQTMARKILLSLSKFENTRAKLRIRVALEPLLEGSHQ